MPATFNVKSDEEQAEIIAKREKKTLEEVQKTIDELEALGVPTLSDEQRGFIRARVSYLSDRQKKVFAEVLAKKSEKAAEDDDTQKSKEPTLTELKERADKVGLKYKPGTSKADFLTQIEEAEKAAEEQGNN